MVDPDRTLLILNEIRGELRWINTRLDSIDRRLDFEFGEIHDRLRRLDERIDGFTIPIKN
jgi:tetrahydromethanopterin S-methyltransferase subunit G